MRPTIAILAAALALAHAPLAHAWDVVGTQWPQAHRGDLITLTYSYNNLLDGGLKGPDGISLPTSLIRASIEEALSLWAGAVPINFVEVPDQGRKPIQVDYPDGDYGQIRLSHQFINGPDVPGEDPKAKAVTAFPEQGRNLAGDIFFDDGDPWQMQGTLSTPDILGCAIHELGHALGLWHSEVPTANMYFIFQRYNGPGTGAALTPDDIAGIQSIYGPGTGSVTPLPEPTSLVILTLTIPALLQRRRTHAPRH